jgi:creatinine amidohydrolase
MTAPAEPRDLVLSSLSWPEIRDIRDQVELVLLPIGSNEQHGPNLSVNFDITAAYEFSRRASARRYPRLLVAPPIPWGVSFHHMNFPGTITLSVNTFMQVLVEVVASLKAHGFERFLIVNGHGGNVQPMGAATVRIKEEVNPLFIGACSHFSFQDRAEIDPRHGITGITGHACETETAVGMYIAPHTVKTDALAAGELTDLALGFRKTMARYNVTVPYRFDEFTTNGALGDARNATWEYGRDLVEGSLDNFVAFTDALVANTPLPAEE